MSYHLRFMQVISNHRHFWLNLHHDPVLEHLKTNLKKKKKKNILSYLTVTHFSTSQLSILHIGIYQDKKIYRIKTWQKPCPTSTLSGHYLHIVVSHPSKYITIFSSITTVWFILLAGSNITWSQMNTKRKLDSDSFIMLQNPKSTHLFAPSSIVIIAHHKSVLSNQTCHILLYLYRFFPFDKINLFGEIFRNFLSMHPAP